LILFFKYDLNLFYQLNQTLTCHVAYRSRRAQVRAAINQKLVESGEKEKYVCAFVLPTPTTAAAPQEACCRCGLTLTSLWWYGRPGSRRCCEQSWCSAAGETR
jgi:hypothetical protein